MRAERLIALLFTLQNRRSATIGELARTLEVSERTMARDIAALQGAGVPLWTETGRNGGVRLVEGWRSRLDGLTSREAVALFAMGVPQALAELGLGSAVTTAHAKVSATLPSGLRDQAQLVAQRFHLDAPGWFRRDEDTTCLATVAAAVWERRTLTVDYGRPDGTVQRTVAPLGLVLKAGTWYLVARGGSAIRTYRVGRIRTATALETTFERPAGFDLATWWAESSAAFEVSLQRTAVRVRLGPRGVRALGAVLDDAVARRALAAAGPPDAAGWVETVIGLEEPRIAAGQLLALGPDVEVLEPAEVRTVFAETARRMADLNTP